MINPKYYQDIKSFPGQFNKALQLCDELKLPKQSFQELLICGMGGSALYGDMLNQIVKKKIVTTHSGYDLPERLPANAFYIAVSYSGNTEESISSLLKILERKLPVCVITSGGELLQIAKENNLPLVILPKGTQPRLMTGYFIAICLFLINKLGIDKLDLTNIANYFSELPYNIDEKEAESLAKKLINKTPIIYGDDQNWSVCKIVKIKFNENSKVESYWNYFPELNHNEMVGFTRSSSEPAFIVLESNFTHERNKKRIEVFKKIMLKEDHPVEVIKLQGKDKIQEMLNAYYFFDYVTYFLANLYGIDPEPVEMVEEFKKRLG